MVISNIMEKTIVGIHIPGEVFLQPSSMASAFGVVAVSLASVPFLNEVADVGINSMIPHQRRRRENYNTSEIYYSTSTMALTTSSQFTNFSETNTSVLIEFLSKTTNNNTTYASVSASTTTIKVPHKPEYAGSLPSDDNDGSKLKEKINKGSSKEISEISGQLLTSNVINLFTTFSNRVNSNNATDLNSTEASGDDYTLTSSSSMEEFITSIPNATELPDNHNNLTILLLSQPIVSTTVQLANTVDIKTTVPSVILNNLNNSTHQETAEASDNRNLTTSSLFIEQTIVNKKEPVTDESTEQLIAETPTNPLDTSVLMKHSVTSPSSDQFVITSTETNPFVVSTSQNSTLSVTSGSVLTTLPLIEELTSKPITTSASIELPTDPVTSNTPSETNKLSNIETRTVQNELIEHATTTSFPEQHITRAVKSHQFTPTGLAEDSNNVEGESVTVSYHYLLDDAAKNSTWPIFLNDYNPVVMTSVCATVMCFLCFVGVLLSETCCLCQDNRIMWSSVTSQRKSKNSNDSVNSSWSPILIFVILGLLFAIEVTFGNLISIFLQQQLLWSSGKAALATAAFWFCFAIFMKFASQLQCCGAVLLSCISLALSSICLAGLLVATNQPSLVWLYVCGSGAGLAMCIQMMLSFHASTLQSSTIVTFSSPVAELILPAVTCVLMDRMGLRSLVYLIFTVSLLALLLIIVVSKLVSKQQSMQYSKLASGETAVAEELQMAPLPVLEQQQQQQPQLNGTDNNDNKSKKVTFTASNGSKSLGRLDIPLTHPKSSPRSSILKLAKGDKKD